MAGAVTPAPAWQESKEQALQRRLAEEQFALLQGTAREAEQMVQDALGRLEDPAHIGCTGSAGKFPGAHQTQCYPNLPPRQAPFPSVLWVVESGCATVFESCSLSACRLPPLQDAGSLRVRGAAAGRTQQIPFRSRRWELADPGRGWAEGKGQLGHLWAR